MLPNCLFIGNSELTRHRLLNVDIPSIVFLNTYLVVKFDFYVHFSVYRITSNITVMK